MKVFILTEGGKNIGFGHITRCISLYQAFENIGIKPKLIINGDNNIKSLLKGKRYLKINWIKEKSKLFRLIDNSDIVIVDSYLACLSIYKHLSKMVKIPVYIDDNNRIVYPRGIVINGNIYARDLRYPKNNRVNFFLGPQYIPMRKEFWKVASKKTKQKLNNIMITFGGDDSKNMTLKIQRFLNKRFPQMKKSIIVGKAFNNIRLIKKESDKNTSLYYCPDAKKIKSIMLDSDIAISASGQTIYELARVGVPTIAITVADNQLYNAKKWGTSGFLKHAGWYENKNLYKNIARYIKEFFSYKKRFLSARLGKKLVSGQGANLVVDAIIKEKG